MKNVAALLLLLALVALLPLPSRGEPSEAAQPGPALPAHADTITDAEFARKIVEVFTDCQKIKPGMTRAEFIKLNMFDEDWGPISPANSNIFTQRVTFGYRSCWLIKVDVDFGATGNQDARPTDVITKVSMPYIDARPRA